MDLRKAARDPWVWGQATLILLVVVGLPWLVRQADPATTLGRALAPASRGWRLAALLPFAAGVLVSLWGVRSLGPNLTPGTEPLAEGTFTDTGAYTRVRHPVYVGVILLLWGAGWWLSNPAIGLVTLVISFVYFDRKAAVEEAWMTRRFPGYAVYRERVPKLIPRLTRPGGRSGS